MASADEEALARELADQLAKLRVEDVLVQALVTASQIGYRSLGLTPQTEESRDLGQARLAIETMQALTPVLERVVPKELVRDFHSAVANLQLAYAKAAGPAGENEPADKPPAEAEPSEGTSSEEEPSEEKPSDP